MQPFKTVLLSALVAALTTGAACAGTKTLQLDMTDIVADEPDSLVVPGIGVEMLEASGSSQVGINIVLPRNYKKNSPAILRLQMMSNGTSCNVVFAPVFTGRQHKASVLALADGLESSPAGVTSFAMPATQNKLVTRDFKLKKPTTAIPPTFADQKAGDIILAILGRDAADGADTCTDDLVIRGAKLIYQTP